MRTPQSVIRRFLPLVLLGGGVLPAFGQAATARFGHTSVLLPSHEIMVCGGSSTNADPTGATATCQLCSQENGTCSDVTSLTTARLYHTATLMPNGFVLVVGGISGAGAALNTIQAYDPLNNCWTAEDASLAGAHYRHTATLLKSGSLLACGGYSNAPAWPAAATPSDSCRVIGMAATPTCATPGFSISNVTLLTPKANHSATLLTDGRVFLTGGTDLRVTGLFSATSGYINTSEIYNPDAGTMGGAHALIQARAYHTATAMGDGRILIAGGRNGKDENGNRGILQSTEIYDPFADSIAPGPVMLVRNSSHTAVLENDGTIKIFGGLGNITTTYVAATSLLLRSGSYLEGTNVANSTQTGALNTIPPHASSSTLYGDFKFNLSVPVSGIIKSGIVLLSTPSIIFNGGAAYLVPGFDPPQSLGGGLQIDLSGRSIDAGAIEATFELKAVSGTYTIQDFNYAPDPVALGSTAGNITWADGGFLNTNTSPKNLNPATSNLPMATVVIKGLSSKYVNPKGTATPAKIRSIVIELLGGTIASSTSTLTITRAFSNALNVAGGINITADTDGTGTATIPGVLFSSMTGAISSNYAPAVPGSVTDGYCSNQQINSSADGPAWASSPHNQFNTGGGCLNQSALGIANKLLPTTVLSGMSARVHMFIDAVGVNDASVVVDVSTIIIKEMVFGDQNILKPKTGAWSFGTPTIAGARYGHTSVVVPSGDLRLHGGLSCPTAGPCVASPGFPNNGVGASGATVGAVTYSGGVRLSYVPVHLPWGAASGNMTTKRANHSSTVLPNGKVLVVGGTDGPNALNTAELYDPRTKVFTPTGPMNQPRVFHTATLLPNGRVLVSGGFATTNFSSAATNTSEIYYPDRGVWVVGTNMSSARAQHTATMMADGNVLAVGGLNNGSYLSSVDVYYSSAGTWQSVTGMAAARARHSATLLKTGEVLVAGGLNAGGALNSLLLYTGGAWSVLGDALNTPLFLHTATLLSDGRVLIAGGNNGAGEVNFSYVFDRSAASGARLSATGNTITPRFNHTATLAPNGVVWAVGGARAGDNALKTVETFNPALSSWTQQGNLRFARAYHTVTFSQDGNLTAVGGYDGLNHLNSADTKYFTGGTDAETTGAPPSVRQSSIAVAEPIRNSTGAYFTVIGRNFGGYTEAGGGGAGSANSSFFHPRVYLQALDSSGGSSSQGNGGFLLDLSTEIFRMGLTGSNQWKCIVGDATCAGGAGVSSITVTLPQLANRLPAGWYHARVANNSQFSDSQIIQVGPPVPTSAVSNLRNIAVTSNSATYSWDALTGVDGYNVYLASTGVWLATAPATPGTVAFIQSPLNPNATAAIQVSGFTMSGDGPLAGSATTYTLSTAPVGVLPSSVSFNSVTLRWNPNRNTLGTYYEISMSTDDPSSNGRQPFTTSFSTPFAVVPINDRLTSTSAVIPNLLSNTTYYFRVRAFNFNLDPSSFSALSSATTFSPIINLTGYPCGNSTPGTCPDPGAGSSCVTWSWTPQPGVLSYRVYNSTAGGLIKAVSGAQSTYDDIGLGTNTMRVVQVSAVTAAGEGPLSASATVYTCAALPVAVNPAFDAGSASTSSVKVSWGNNANPIGTFYVLHVATAVLVSTGVAPSTATTTAFSATITGLAPAQIYVASVAAVNGDSPARMTNFVSLGLGHTLANPPASLAVTGANSRSIQVAWTANGNASTATYQVTLATVNPATTAFMTWVSTPVPFSQGFAGLSANITGLVTGQPYWVVVSARNGNGATTQGVTVATTTPNGGAAAGSLAGVTDLTNPTVIEGTLGDGRYVSLTIPAGSFASNVGVTISSFTNLNSNLCGGTTNIALDIVTTPHQQPTKPLILTVSYRTPPDVAVSELGDLDPAQASLMRYDPSLSKCVPLPTTVNTAQKLITASLNHLSIHMLGGVSPSDSPSKTRIFPNPFFAATDGFITFSQMPSYARVRIFTTRGELIYDDQANGSGIMLWPVTNRAGRGVASGVYLVAVEDVGRTAPRKLLKVVVLR